MNQFHWKLKVQVEKYYNFLPNADLRLMSNAFGPLGSLLWRLLVSTTLITPHTQSIYRRDPKPYKWVLLIMLFNPSFPPHSQHTNCDAKCPSWTTSRPSLHEGVFSTLVSTLIQSGNGMSETQLKSLSSVFVVFATFDFPNTLCYLSSLLASLK